VASTASSRYYRTLKEAGRPIPQLHDDDVIDYCILEAISVKVRKEDEEAEKTVAKSQWKRDQEAIAKLRSGESAAGPEDQTGMAGLTLEKF
jgi:hypothetical protein